MLLHFAPLHVLFIDGNQFYAIDKVCQNSVRQMGLELFDLILVASFRFFEKLAVEMFDLRDPFWNNGIQPADRSRK